MFAQARCQSQLLATEPERHAESANTPPLAAQLSFDVYDLCGDLVLTVLDRTNWGKAGFGDAALGRAVVPLSALLTSFLGVEGRRKVRLNLAFHPRSPHMQTSSLDMVRAATDAPGGPHDHRPL